MPRNSALPAAALLVAALLPSPAEALTPAEVFRKVSPSVWMVRGLDASEKHIRQGSGVVVGPGRMITNCHVLARARGIQVRRGNASFGAKLEHADAERDLCTLTIDEFAAPAVEIRALGDLSVGERVYTVGNPEGLSQTLSEGLISGLRPEDPKLPPIQTSAPISPGSSGGGLFDEQGRLIGITTLSVNARDRLSQNLNFAMPAEWIAEVPERAKAALAARRAAGATATASAAGADAAPAPNPASASLPRAGSTFRYQWTERQYNRRQEFTVEISSVNGSIVTERTSIGSGPPRTTLVNATTLAFGNRALDEGQSLLEFAPYLETGVAEKGVALDAGTDYPTGGYEAWTYSASPPQWDTVSVSAGNFRALRLDIRGTRQTGATPTVRNHLTERFEFTAWYAPDLKRYVRLRHQNWGAFNNSLGIQEVDLVEHKRPL